MYHTHKSKAREIADIVAGAVAIILALDMFSFMLWIASGQHPVDGFYFGAITANVLKLFI